MGQAQGWIKEVGGASQALLEAAQAALGLGGSISYFFSNFRPFRGVQFSQPLVSCCLLTQSERA